MYGGLLVEYGFIFSATRRLALASTSAEIQDVVAGVSGAKLLLSLAAFLAAFAAYLILPLFHANPLLLSVAVLSEIVKAFLPIYYFYGMRRVALASLLDISARAVAAVGIFIFVHRPADVWKFFALQAAGAGAAFFAGHAMIHARHGLRRPRFTEGVRMLREGGPMFLFRSAHNIYVLGNAFILGLFAPTQAVGYYSGAEKINSAAMGLLSPITTALYPRTAGMVNTSLPKTAKLTRVSWYVMGAVSLVLGAIMWFGSSLIVRIILGREFSESAGVLKILSLRSPMVAWINVLGFQWLLALGLEKSFQRVTVAALLLNVLLAACFAPAFSYTGMAWAVVISQAVAVIGVYIVVRSRGLNPFARTFL